MNILFLSPARGPDYQCDALFHGLRSLYGPSVVDYPRIPYLYSDYGDLTQLYGRGFTLYGLLPEIPVDRQNIRERIAAHDFDFIIYGSVRRDRSMLALVTTHYRKHEILLIDGEDDQYLEDHPLTVLGAHIKLAAILGTYFKRELIYEVRGVHPIHFAIPASKCYTLRDTPKSRVRAFIDPRDRSTYIYTTERDYYLDYARSLFGFTTKKAGWDQLRTLEMLANRCIPLYLDLADCPATTCTNLPKAELLEALTWIDRDASFWDTQDGKSTWLSLWRRMQQKFAQTSTTEALARYVLDVAVKEATR